jgi:hypothetical protein
MQMKAINEAYALICERSFFRQNTFESHAPVLGSSWTLPRFRKWWMESWSMAVQVRAFGWVTLLMFLFFTVNNGF